MAKEKPKQPSGEKKPGGEKKPSGDKKSAAPPKDKAKDKVKAEAPKPEKVKEKAPEPPRPPADPRMKLYKKFQGRFLPRGPLRDRHKAILDRWNADTDHGGVTLDELKALLADWKASRSKPAQQA